MNHSTGEMIRRVERLARVAAVLDDLGIVPHVLSVSNTGYFEDEIVDGPAVDIGVSDPAEFLAVGDALGLDSTYGTPESNAYRNGHWQGIPILTYTSAAGVDAIRPVRFPAEVSS